MSTSVDAGGESDSSTETGGESDSSTEGSDNSELSFQENKQRHYRKKKSLWYFARGNQL